MELHRPQSMRLAHLDCSGEALSIIRDGDRLPSRRPVIRVAVIHKAAIRNAAHEYTLRLALLTTDLKLAPADVRHFEDAFKATDTPR